MQRLASGMYSPVRSFEVCVGQRGDEIRARKPVCTPPGTLARPRAPARDRHAADRADRGDARAPARRSPGQAGCTITWTAGAAVTASLDDARQLDRRRERAYGSERDRRRLHYGTTGIYTVTLTGPGDRELADARLRNCGHDADARLLAGRAARRAATLNLTTRARSPSEAISCSTIRPATTTPSSRAPRSRNGGSLQSQSEGATNNYLRASVDNTSASSFTVASGELLQDQNTTISNAGTLDVAGGALLDLTTGGDKLTNTSSVTDHGTSR